MKLEALQPLVEAMDSVRVLRGRGITGALRGCAEKGDASRRGLERVQCVGEV
jgi:hypothetical protein